MLRLPKLALFVGFLCAIVPKGKYNEVREHLQRH